MYYFFIELCKNFLSNPFILTLFLLGIFGAFFYKIVVGKAGEYYVNKELKKLPQDKYKIFYDIMIEVDGETHQIDHIVTSSFGIFVIETKHWHGFITGSFNDYKWTGHRGRSKYSVCNPIRQNYGHIDALAKLLNVNQEKFINIVCFTADITLKLNRCFNVIYYYELVNKIISYDKYIVDNVEDINNLIEKYNITDKRTRREHVKRLKNKYGE